MNFINNYERNLFETRYKRNDNEKYWTDIFKRVSDFVGNTKEEKELFYNMMSKAEFLPSSPQLMNFGTDDNNGSSCFTGKIRDNLESIYLADYTACKIYKNAGGIGFLLDDIRPRGSKIRNSKNSSVGVMSIIKKLNDTTTYITAGGRARGALMIQLSIEHPDAVEFIFSKRPIKMMSKSINNKNDWDEQFILPFQSCNMSVRLSDKFMKAIDNNDDWEFYWKDNKQEIKISTYRELIDNLKPNPYEMRDVEYQRFFKYVLYPALKDKRGNIKAKWLWDIIIENAWNHSDPGIINVDLYNKYSPFPEEYKILSNPCVTANTKVLTINGEKSIIDLVGKKIQAWNGEKYSEVEPRQTGSNEPILHIEFNNNKYIDCTFYHPFFINRNNKIYKIKAEELKIGDKIENKIPKLFNNEKINNTIIETENKNIYVTKIKNIGIVEKVYCFKEPLKNKGCFNGIITGQCSEYVAPEGSSCLLGSINLRSIYDENNKINLNKLSKLSKNAVLYLNNALNKTKIDIGYIEEGTKKDFRQIGLGLMGLADLFIMNKLKYGSKESINLTEEIVEEMALSAWEKSFELAKEDIKKYPKPNLWTKERIKNIFIERKKKGKQKDRWNKLIELVDKYKYAANCSVLSIAPTGTISLICGFILNNQGISSGIEPIYNWETQRNDTSGNTIIKYDLIKNNDINNLPEYFVKTDDITPEEHIEILSAAAKFTCLSVSKTVNLPFNASINDVSKCYKLAYEKDIKGTTVYRDRSKPFQVLSIIESEENISHGHNMIGRVDQKKIKTKIKEDGKIKERTMPAIRHKVKVEGIPFYIFVATCYGRPAEIFAVTNYKADTIAVQDANQKMFELCNNSGIPKKWINLQLEKSHGNPRQRLTRLVSLCLRHGIIVDEIINVLENCKENTIINLPTQIANKLKQYKIEKELCPVCKEGEIIYSGGCTKCNKCDYVGGCG